MRTWRPDRRGVVIAEGVAVVERLLASPLSAAVYSVRRLASPRSRTCWPAFRTCPAYSADRWFLSDVVGFRLTREGPCIPANRLPCLRCGRSAGATGSRSWSRLNDFENLGSLFLPRAAFGGRRPARCRAAPICSTGGCPGCRWSRACTVPFAVLPESRAVAPETLREIGFTLVGVDASERGMPLAAVRAAGPLGGPARR